MIDPLIDPPMDRAPCGFVAFADDGRVVAVNATLLARLGYARDEVVGRHVEALLPVAGRLFFQTHLFPLVRMHGAAQELFLLLRTRDGEEVGALCNAARRADAGVTDCVLLEVRERRRFEEALLQAKREAEAANAVLEAQAAELEAQQQLLQEQATELEAQAEHLSSLNQELREHGEELERQRAKADEANRAKSSFLAMMSHELRTPLNAIGGYAELMRLGVYGAMSEQQRQAIDRIDRSQRHLLRLINDILNLSRLESGRVEYAIAPVSLAQAIADVLPMVEPQMAARGLRREVRVPDDLVVLADREKLQQILLNLLTNATKFTNPGGGVRVLADRHSTPAGLVDLRVVDSGIGIPAAMQDRIFEPFVQVDDSRTRASEGTGLGLAISRDLARGMGGELSLESEVGVGSAFTLTLREASAAPTPPVPAGPLAATRD